MAKQKKTHPFDLLLIALILANMISILFLTDLFNKDVLAFMGALFFFQCLLLIPDLSVDMRKKVMLAGGLIIGWKLGQVIWGLV